MEILLEVEGSRKVLSVTRDELVYVLENELNSISYPSSISMPGCHPFESHPTGKDDNNNGYPTQDIITKFC